MSAETIRAVFSGPTHDDGLYIDEAPGPEPAQNQAVVQVSAFSLNAGEVRDSLNPISTWRPGWDLAGVVAEPAVDGSGPGLGARVVGFAGIAGGGWGEKVAVRTDDLAEVPDNVTFAQAACLPVAGLTALYALERRGALLGRSVLVTGASGGVGWIASQLCLVAGARVTASVRRPEAAQQLGRLGVHRTILTANEAGDERYDLILESVGGESLAWSMAHLELDGVCVLYGNSSAEPTTFVPSSFYHPGRATLQGLFLGTEVEGRKPGESLSRLARLVSNQQLDIPIEAEDSWLNVAKIARAYSRREITGKAVLHIAG
jgi:NADPH2:quinone reductase